MKQQPRRPRYMSLVVMSALVLGACNGDGADAPTPAPATVDTEAVAPEDADVPDEFVAAVLADVVARTGLTAAELTVLDSTAVEWADQRLGCVHFDEPSDPEPVNGYRVVVDSGDAEFDYRLDAGGAYALCGDPVVTPRNVPDDGDGHEDEPDNSEPVTS